MSSVQRFYIEKYTKKYVNSISQSYNLHNHFYYEICIQNTKNLTKVVKDLGLIILFIYLVELSWLVLIFMTNHHMVGLILFYFF